MRFNRTTLLSMFVLISLTTSNVSAQDYIISPVIMEGEFAIFTFLVGQENFPRYEVEYQGVTHSIEKKKYIEFDDADGDKMYDPGEEIDEMSAGTWTWSLNHIPITIDQRFDLLGVPDLLIAPFDVRFSNQFDVHNEWLKFDVELSNYAFSDESHLLAIQFEASHSIVTTVASSGPTIQTESKVWFGNAYLSITTQSNTPASPAVSAKLSTETTSTKNFIYISYDNFGDNLEHDPTLGVGGGNDGVSSGGGAPFPISTVILSTFLVVLVIRRRK